MKSENSVLLALAFAALAGPAAAQTNLAEAYDSAHAAATTRPAASSGKVEKSITSCDDAKELETPFDFTLTPPDGAQPLELEFKYAGCESVPRNDYQAPYTNHFYEAKDGYALTIVTDEGSAQSEVLLSKGNAWLGRVEAPGNAALASGDPVTARTDDFQDSRKSIGQAVLRNAAKPLYPQLKACESADWSKFAAAAPVRTAGKPATGWEGRLGPSLVLLTKTAAFYYHEDCDICAAITKCDLAGGALSTLVEGHSADYRDLSRYRSEPGVVYDASGSIKP